MPRARLRPHGRLPRAAAALPGDVRFRLNSGHAPEPWPSWREALAWYRGVRLEYLALPSSEEHRRRFDREPFIERLFQRFGAAGPPADWCCPIEAQGWSPEAWDAGWTPAMVAALNREHHRAVLSVLTIG